MYAIMSARVSKAECVELFSEYDKVGNIPVVDRETYCGLKFWIMAEKSKVAEIYLSIWLSENKKVTIIFEY